MARFIQTIKEPNENNHIYKNKNPFSKHSLDDQNYGLILDA
jgi:hypothetical protein